MFDNINIIDIITFIGVVYAGIQVYLLRKTNKDNHEWNRRISSQDAIINIGNYSGDVITDLNNIFDTLNIKESIPLDKILTSIQKDKSIQIKINHVLNSYEALARGIAHSVYDEQIIKDARRGMIIRQYNTYCNYIENRRQVLSNQNIYRDLESLVNKWKLEDNKSNKREKTG
jgi:hypothetical protein